MSTNQWWFRCGCGAGCQTVRVTSPQLRLVWGPPHGTNKLEIHHLMHTTEKSAEGLQKRKKENELNRKLRVVRALTLESVFEVYTVHVRLSDCI